MIFALKHNLGNLTRFSGRTGPKAFWLYVAALLLAYMGALMAMILPVMVSAMAAVRRAAGENGDPVQPATGPDLGLFATVNAVVVIAIVALLAASVTRRLHDSNRRGWWGLMPLPFLLTGMVVMATEFGSAGEREPDMQIFMLIGINNLIYLALLAVLVVLLALGGTRGPNRFGEPPA